MATLNTILTYARAQAQTNSNGLSDANGIIFANEALLDFHRQLIKHGIDASQIQESYRDGTVGTGTYLYPTDMFFLKAIEVNYQNANAQEYLTASQVDYSNLPAGTSFSWLRQNANASRPQFADNGDYFEIFPTPTSANNVSQMFRIVYFKNPTEYSATSDTITYPVSLDYRILGWRIVADYLYSLGATTGSGRNVHLLGDTFLGKYTERVKDLVSTLGRGVQTPMEATVIQDTGWNF